MSTLYLGTSPESLAEQLASLLEESTRGGDFFASQRIIVPNRYVAKWLRLWLARRLGIAINLDILYLETATWQLLCALDPRDRNVATLDDDVARFMVLAQLLEDDGDEALAPLRAYLRRPGGDRRRDFYRRAWQLAERLTGLIRDYEYHRHDTLIRRWLDNRRHPADDALGMDRAQRTLYRRLILEPDGLAARLAAQREQVLRTLPQYVDEVLSLPPESLRKPARPGPVFLFGITQISPLHAGALHWLGRHYDLRLFHLNPLVGSLQEPIDAGQLKNVADCYRPQASGNAVVPSENELLKNWGQAGAESLWVMADFLAEPGAFQVASIAAPNERTAGTSVLGRVQDQVLAKAVDEESRLAQDTTLQIVGCPGIFREVETVYQSIVHNLQHDPTLKQTDVAVLVTDMPRYRPVLQAVFDRRPRRLLYNLADFSAAELSDFGQAVLGMLDLALETFTRSRVFAVLLNPCFLAGLGVDRDQALQWLEWADTLGIYHGWDPSDKQERGYANTPLYCWRLGLQRLRLGRLMDVADENSDAPTPRFHDVIPYVDLESSDKEQLDAFCRAVEGLLPLLIALRKNSLAGAEWARQLRRLVTTFLDIPEDRPEEEEVRDRLLADLTRLAELDDVTRLAGHQPAFPLALVREVVQESLTRNVGTKGDYLTGGVTISALQPLRPVPFRIIYVIGLGEGLFPGTNHLPAIDLRARERVAGDILLAESNRFLLLETLLAARQKLYLCYTSHDLQRDQELHPCSPVNQLRRYLEKHVVAGKFARTETPLCAHDVSYLAAEAATTSDVRVNYSEVERLLALDDGLQTGRIQVDEPRRQEVETRLARLCPNFVLPVSDHPTTTALPTIKLGELRNFLRCPAEAALRRHLGLEDEEELEPRDDEPFYTASQAETRLVTRFLRRFIREAQESSPEQALEDWRQQFGELYNEWRLRGRMPDGAFADVDRNRIETGLHERITGADGIAHFLEERRTALFCGPVLLGESVTPIGARTRLPALQLEAARVVGHQPCVWQSHDALDVLVLTNRDSRKILPDQLSVPMFEPLLFFLALKADSAPLLGEREFHLHLALVDGIATVTYRADDITSDEARAYLTELVRDLLDRTSFDLLPFELTGENRFLPLPYQKTDDEILGMLRQIRDGSREKAKPLRAELGTDAGYLSSFDQPDDALLAEYQRRYATLFEETYEEDRLKDWPSFYPMELLEMVEPAVPADAWAKMQRRFTVLDRGPARNRQATAPKKTDKPRKPRRRRAKS
jgi:exonuclease V gamma subunit